MHRGKPALISTLGVHFRSKDYVGEGARPSEQASQEPVEWSLQGLTLVGYSARGGYRANGTSKLWICSSVASSCKFHTKDPNWFGQLTRVSECQVQELPPESLITQLFFFFKRGRVYAITRSSADGRVCRNRVKEKQLIWGWGQKVVEGQTVERQAVGLFLRRAGFWNKEGHLEW